MRCQLHACGASSYVSRKFIELATSYQQSSFPALQMPVQFHPMPMPRNSLPCTLLNPATPSILTSQVGGRSSSRALGSDISLCHATVDNEVAAVDEAGLVGSQEQDSLCLLDSLAETARGEVHLTPVTLGLVVSEPVLEERSVERCRAESVEAEALTGVDDGELAGHGEDGALGGCVGELGSGGTDECDDGCGVDDAALGLLVLTEGQDGVLAAEPHTLDVDVLGQVPDLLGCVNGV